MKVTSKTQYGLRILMHIAAESELGRLAQGKDIALRQQINEPYLEQIMVLLKKAGLVTTVRGRRGGYQLAKAPAEISLLEVIETFEGELSLVDPPEAASGGISPEIRAGERVWSDLADQLREQTRAISLKAIREHHAEPNPEYVI